MTDTRILNIVNDADEVIGEVTREEIHEKGLLHREIHVWFFTPKGEIVFQHRAKDKDTFPDLLDATVGGHVEVGDTYEETAVKEAGEETGISITEKDLIPLKKLKHVSHDYVSKKINNAFKMEFAFRFTGNIEALKIEKDKAIGFEAIDIDVLFNSSEENKKRFIPAIFESDFLDLFKEIKKLL